MMLAVIIGGGLTFVFVSDPGYQLFWDDRHFAVRAWGWAGLFRRHPAIAMAYRDVIDVEPRFYRNVGMKPSFMPFEYLAVTDSSEQGTREVWIYPPAFYDSGIKDFLRHFHSERPELFDEAVTEYILSERQL